MVNVNTTLYLSEDDYKDKFIPRKKEVLAKMREVIKEELKIKNKR